MKGIYENLTADTFKARADFYRAGSLDAPLGDNESDLTLGDMVEDPFAAEAFERAEGRIWEGQLKGQLEKALEAITVDNRFSQQLQRLRKHRGLSWMALGELSKNTIALYERGERCPSLDALLALADFFDVATDELLGQSL